MDFYVRAFGVNKDHDEFYTDDTIINLFTQNYTQAIVSRYSNSAALLSWELANDPRCSSSIPSSTTCNTNTITSWANRVGGFIRSIDKNHLVASGFVNYFLTDNDLDANL
jgi:mannan endo-1,4-beta-mannosidase